MINLNDESYDSKPGKQVFNNGVAGVVENVTVSIEKKKPEDKEKAPEYKVNFTAPDGGVINLSFWYITEKTEYKSLDDLIKAQAKLLKHILHAMLGKDTSLPSFANAKEMLDGCLRMVHDASKSGVKFKVATNYGFWFDDTSGKRVEKHSQYIGIRSWVPFMQPMSSEEDLLKVSKSEYLTPLKPDSETSTETDTSAPKVVDDWD